MKKVFPLIVILFLISCSTTVPINYVASPMMRGSGDIDIGVFIYEAAERGDVAQNQYQPAAVSIGSMYMSEKASDLLEGALRKELTAAGFNVIKTADLEISGNIQKFVYDWVGFVEVDFYLDVEYIVKDKTSVVYQNVVRIHKASPKTVLQDSEATRAAVAESISTLLHELRNKKII